MGNSSFHEFKKQASFFFREKIKTARLALTDVTPAQLMAEEATRGNHPWPPDTPTMRAIARAAFEIDDYSRIVEILHKRISKFDVREWRVSYKALILLEHLLTHGPQSFAEEFQADKDVVRQMSSFLHIDEKGFDWGLRVRTLSDRVMKLLDNPTFLREERCKARTLSRGIQGFGSFSGHSMADSSFKGEQTFRKCCRSNSVSSNHRNNLENDFSASNESFSTPIETGDNLENCHNDVKSVQKREPGSNFWVINGEGYAAGGEHPFCDGDQQTSASLLSAVD